jgi:quercetin dioxygenase-like cupin family protein
MSVIHQADSRRTETPNAVMTTLASPTQGDASQSLWRVDMRPGQAGPLHGIDAEQLFTVIEGGASVELGAQTITVGPGDTIVMPADVARRVAADPRQGLVAIVTASPAMRAYVLAGPTEGPPVSDGDKLVPGWVV